MLSTNLAQPVFQSMQLQRAKPIAALWVRNTESDVNDGSGTGHMTTLQVPTIEGSWMKHQQAYDVKKQIEELRRMEHQLLEELYEKRHILMIGMKTGAQSGLGSSRPSKDLGRSARIPTETTEPMVNSMSFRRVQVQPQSTSQTPVIPIFSRAAAKSSVQSRQNSPQKSMQQPRLSHPKIVISPQYQGTAFPKATPPQEERKVPEFMKMSLELPNEHHGRPRIDLPMNDGSVTLRNHLPTLVINPHQTLPIYQPDETLRRAHVHASRPSSRNNMAVRHNEPSNFETHSDHAQLIMTRKDSFTSVEYQDSEEPEYDTYLRLQENIVGRQKLELSRLNHKISLMNGDVEIRPRMSLNQMERPKIREGRVIEPRKSIKEKSKSKDSASRMSADRQLQNSPTKKGKELKQADAKSRRSKTPNRSEFFTLGPANEPLPAARSNKSDILETKGRKEFRRSGTSNNTAQPFAAKQNIMRRASTPEENRRLLAQKNTTPSLPSSMLDESIQESNEQTIRFLYLLHESILLENHVEKLRVKLSPVLDEALQLIGLDESTKTTTHKRLSAKLTEFIRGGRSFGKKEVQELVQKLFPNVSKISRESVSKLISPVLHSPYQSPRKRLSPQDEEVIEQLLHQVFCLLAQLTYFEECLVEQAGISPNLIVQLFDRIHQGPEINVFDLVNYLRIHTNNVVDIEAVELYLDRRLQKDDNEAYYKSDLLALFIR